MADIAIDERPIEPAKASTRPNLDKGFNPITAIIFFGVMAAGLLFVGYSLVEDVNATGAKVTTYLPYICLLYTSDAADE